jgi:hypothetical protein
MELEFADRIMQKISTERAENQRAGWPPAAEEPAALV